MIYANRSVSPGAVKATDNTPWRNSGKRRVQHVRSKGRAGFTSPGTVPPSKTPFPPAFSPSNLAKPDRTDSRRRTAVCSGPDSRVFVFYSPANPEGEGIGVQPGTIRATMSSCEIRARVGMKRIERKGCFVHPGQAPTSPHQDIPPPWIVSSSENPGRPVSDTNGEPPSPT